MARFSTKQGSLTMGHFSICLKLKIPVLKVSQLLNEIEPKKILVNTYWWYLIDSKCTPKYVNMRVSNLIFKMLAQLHMHKQKHKLVKVSKNK